MKKKTLLIAIVVLVLIVFASLATQKPNTTTLPVQEQVVVAPQPPQQTEKETETLVAEQELPAPSVQEVIECEFVSQEVCEALEGNIDYLVNQVGQEVVIKILGKAKIFENGEEADKLIMQIADGEPFLLNNLEIYQQVFKEGNGSVSYKKELSQTRLIFFFHGNITKENKEEWQKPYSGTLTEVSTAFSVIAVHQYSEPTEDWEDYQSFLESKNIATDTTGATLIWDWSDYFIAKDWKKVSDVVGLPDTAGEYYSDSGDFAPSPFKNSNVSLGVTIFPYVSMGFDDGTFILVYARDNIPNEFKKLEASKLHLPLTVNGRTLHFEQSLQGTITLYYTREGDFVSNRYSVLQDSLLVIMTGAQTEGCKCFTPIAGWESVEAFIFIE